MSARHDSRITIHGGAAARSPNGRLASVIRRLDAMCGQGSWRYECMVNWLSTDPEDLEPYSVYLAQKPVKP